MSGPANVRNIPAIRQFRAAVMTFLEEANGSLELVAMEMQKAFDWAEHDRHHYWQREIKRTFDKVAIARSALTTCKMKEVAGHRPSCIEEKKALAVAKRRLQNCHDQIERTKKWSVKIRKEADELRGRLAGTRRQLDSSLPTVMALLEKTAAVLESYAEMTNPEEGPIRQAPSQNSSTTTSTTDEIERASSSVDDSNLDDQPTQAEG